jgi:hypothetical protein
VYIDYCLANVDRFIVNANWLFALLRVCYSRWEAKDLQDFLPYKATIPGHPTDRINVVRPGVACLAMWRTLYIFIVTTAFTLQYHLWTTLRSLIKTDAATRDQDQSS